MRLLTAFLLLFGIAAHSQTTVPEWRYHTTMPAALKGHRTVLLPDGNILIAGGAENSGISVNSCYLYLHSDGKIIPFLPMNDSRAYFSLVQVSIDENTSKIFVIGGYSGTSGNYSSVVSVETLVYNPSMSSMHWERVGNLPVGRGDCRAAWDGQGSIVVTGGINQNSGPLRSGMKTKNSERIDVGTGKVTALPEMEKARAGHLLCRIQDVNDDWEVITAGGEDVIETGTELLENGEWSSHAFAPREHRSYGAAFGDIAGIARIFGGEAIDGTPKNTCEWYDVKAGWKYAPGMFRSRAHFDISLTAGLKDTSYAYFAIAGKSSSGNTNTTEYYSMPNTNNPSGVWSQFEPLNDAGAGREVSIAGTNLPVVFGGEDENGNPTNRTEIFQPIRTADISFGAEETGRISDSMIVNLRNEWLLPVRLTDFVIESSEFFFTGDTADFVVAPGSSRRLFIRFRPSGEGPRIGYLKFMVGPVSDSISLEGTGIKSSIVILTQNQDFGEIFLGKDTTVCFDAIQNTGNDTTYVDSVSISPASAYTLISPKGRRILAPGEVMEVCIRFHPNNRGDVFGTAISHIGPRSFPSALSGKGILKYISGTGTTGCDTLNYVPGNTYQAMITLRNPSDRPVEVTGHDFIGGFDALFKINQTYPFNVDPGGRKDLMVEFSPTGEGKFSIGVRFENDGHSDSTVLVDLCFVMRSSYLGLSATEIDFGAVCAGDSLVHELRIENPGAFETLTLENIYVSDNTAPVTIYFTKTDLTPHQSIFIPVTFKTDVPGLYDLNITIEGSFGSIDVPLKCSVLADISLEATEDTYTAFAGETFIVPFRASGDFGNSSISSSEIPFRCNNRVIHPMRIVNTGNSQVDEAASSIRHSGGNEFTADIAWNTPLGGPGEAFGIEFEALLGNSYESDIRIDKSVLADFCLEETNSVFYLSGLCGGRSGLINSDVKNLFATYPNPFSGKLEVLAKSENGNLEIEIFNTVGSSIYSNKTAITKNSLNEFSLDLHGLPGGVYMLVASSGSRIIYSGTITKIN